MMLTQMMENDADDDDIQIIDDHVQAKVDFGEISAKHQALYEYQSGSKDKKNYESCHFTMLLIAKSCVDIRDIELKLRKWNEQQKWIFGQYLIRILAQSGYNHLALKNLYDAKKKNSFTFEKILSDTIMQKCRLPNYQTFISMSFDEKQIASSVYKYFSLGFHTGYKRGK